MLTIKEISRKVRALLTVQPGKFYTVYRTDGNVFVIMEVQSLDLTDRYPKLYGEDMIRWDGERFVVNSMRLDPFDVSLTDGVRIEETQLNMPTKTALEQGIRNMWHYIENHHMQHEWALPTLAKFCDLYETLVAQDEVKQAKEQFGIDD